MKKQLLLFILMFLCFSYLGDQLHAQSVYGTSAPLVQNCNSGAILSSKSGKTGKNGAILKMPCPIPNNCKVMMKLKDYCFDCTSLLLTSGEVGIAAFSDYEINIVDFTAVNVGVIHSPISNCNPTIKDCDSSGPSGPSGMNGPPPPPCPRSEPNCLGKRNPGGKRICGICPVIAPPEVPEIECISAANCKGDTKTEMLRVCECPPLPTPDDPTEKSCTSAPNCVGEVNTTMSECGVCPIIEAPPCPPKHPGTCPPCHDMNPFTGACTLNKNINQCNAYPCDDKDPCTSHDVEYVNCDGSICIPCAGKSADIESVTVVNMRDCDDKGNANPYDDTFKGDIVVTFTSSLIKENFIIQGSGVYYSNMNFSGIVSGNTVTIRGRTFKATGDQITLHAIYNGDRLGCSYTLNGLAGQALGPCNGVKEEEPSACVKPAPDSKDAYIEGITIDEVYKCYDGGTVYKTSDDYLEAKVTVHFGKSLPASGVLELSGMVSTYVNLYNVSGSSYTFPRKMKLKYKESNTIKVVAADYHSSHARICPINTYAYYIDEEIFLCDNPCDANITSSSTQSAKVYTNFNAFQQSRRVDLEWLTNQSDKSASYIIEKSIGGDFELLKEIENTEFTDEDSYFKSVDELPELGDNHYRLKQVFMDGHIEYSPVRTVNFGVDLAAISFFPNPAESELYIDLDEYAGKTGHMIISNQLGQIVEDINFTEIPHDLIKVDFANYINGLYFIKVKVDRSKYVAKKVLVSKLY